MLHSDIGLGDQVLVTLAADMNVRQPGLVLQRNLAGFFDNCF
jgi:hypothetical protein